MYSAALWFSAQATHSLLVHLPLLLLLIAPVLLILAGIRRPQRQLFLTLGFAAMVIGTGLLYAARATGDFARAEHQLTAELQTVVSEHRSLATETVAMFALSTGLLGLILFLTQRFRLPVAELDGVLSAGLVILYALGILLLVKTFDRGSHLVHTFGI
jgi:hypothetical protein